MAEFATFHKTLNELVLINVDNIFDISPIGNGERTIITSNSGVEIIVTETFNDVIKMFTEKRKIY